MADHNNHYEAIALMNRNALGVFGGAFALKASKKIKNVFEMARTRNYKRVFPFSVGQIEWQIKNHARRNGIELGSNHLYMTMKQILHSRRPSKIRDGVAVDEDKIVSFPSDKFKMDIYFDKMEKTYIYTDGTNKFYVLPNYELKFGRGKRKLVNYITSKKVSPNENFAGDRFERLK